MRKIIFSLLIFCLIFPASVQPARADGGVFPLEASTGYIQVRYHHVTVDIDGSLAITRVEQEFYNPYDTPVQGRYLFPVPPEAALSQFAAQVDGLDQPYARQDSAATNAELYALVDRRQDPTLLQYAGWETLAFDLTLPPGAARRMTLEYEQVLAPSGGMLRYRYILSTERYSSQPLQQVSLAANIRLPGGLADVYSSSHPVSVQYTASGEARVTWEAENVQPTEDFDLYLIPAGDSFGAGFLTGRRAGRDHFMFIFSPASQLGEDSYLPKDIVFVVDRSGSMSGEKIEQARASLHYFLDQLGEEDRFSIVTFADLSTTFSGTLQPPTAGVLAEAHAYVSRIRADGSTDLETALQKGLAIFNASESRASAARMLVFLTDGLPTAGVTDERAITFRVGDANRTVEARLHVFGVGYDVNTHLLDALASGNGGSVTYVQPGENLETVLTGFFNRIAHPLLTGIEVAFEGLRPSQVSPAAYPDLFEGSSLIVTGLYQAEGPQVSVKVSGMAGGARKETVYTFELDQAGDHGFIPRLWATRRVGELLDRVRTAGETPELVQSIRDLGLDYGIVTPYTVFAIAAQAQGAASVDNMSLYNRQGLNQAYGEVAVQARVQNQAYQQANQANLAAGSNVANTPNASLAQVSGSGLYGLRVELSLFKGVGDLDGPPTQQWLESNIGIDRTIVFASPEYFALADDPNARAFLQTGLNLVFPYQDEVIQVVGPQTSQADHDPVPAPAPTAQPKASLAVRITALVMRLIETLQELVFGGR